MERNISDDEEEDEEAGGDQQVKEMLVEDTHNALKIVLQRQFFEAVARAASVRYSNSQGHPDLVTLANKLDYTFENNLLPNAIKNKSKTTEDEKAFKLADKVFDEYSEQLNQVFAYFSKKTQCVKNDRKDLTIEVEDFIELLNKTNLLDGSTTDLTLEEVINMVEKYYDPEMTLKEKLEPYKFDDYLYENPHLVPEEKEPSQREQPSEGGEPAEANEEGGENNEEVPEKKKDDKMEKVRQQWKDEVISQHLVYIKGVEIIFYEFKELLLELAIRLKDFVESTPGKLKSLIKSFLENLFLKRLKPYIKFDLGKKTSTEVDFLRKWPESEKDKEIQTVMEEKRKREAEEQKLREEENAKKAEIDAQAEAERQAIEEAKAAEEAKVVEEEEKKKTSENIGSGDEEEDEEEDGDENDVDEEDSEY